MQLYERFRPGTLDAYAGHTGVVSEVRGLMADPDWDRDAWWFVGRSGTGKTTLVRCVAAAILKGGVSEDNLAYEEVSGEQVGLDYVQRMGDTMHYCSPDESGWRVWAINEGQQITPNAKRALKTLLEGLPKRRLVLFTSTKKTEGIFGSMEADEAAQLSSRLKVFELDDGELWHEAAAKYVRDRLTSAGLDGQPHLWYLDLARRHQGNMRAMFQECERAGRKHPTVQVAEQVTAQVAQTPPLDQPVRPPPTPPVAPQPARAIPSKAMCGRQTLAEERRKKFCDYKAAQQAADKNPTPELQAQAKLAWDEWQAAAKAAE